MMVVVGLTGFARTRYSPTLGRTRSSRATATCLPIFDWPTSPSWLYALNQGLHVTIGFVAVPLLLLKLWSVIPRLFAWPPVVSPAQALERLSIALLVGSALFLFATGVANAQIYYPFKFNFVQAHYFAAIVFVAALTVHVGVKTRTILHAYRQRGILDPLRADLARTEQEPGDPDGGLVAVEPSAPTISRRGVFGLVGAASAMLAVVVGSQSVGGPFRKLGLLAPRRQSFPVNKTAAAAGVTGAMTGPSWALELRFGDQRMRVPRQDLLQLPQRREALPIACVEGWSTTQTWTGVRIADLARAVGAPEGARCFVESLQPRGQLREATLSADQVADDRSLLALQVDDDDLSLDHGYPARVIVPALPGVHNTKWVARMTFS
jgi:DMSO/TMAO reductase YedYZ molybdopterin-dependent catalytic subunit